MNHGRVDLDADLLDGSRSDRCRLWINQPVAINRC